MYADFTDNADIGLAIRVDGAERKFLLGEELVAGKNSGTVLAEHDGVGLLRENFPLQVAPGEDNGDLFGNASAATDSGVRHLGNLGKGPRLVTRLA